MSAGVVSWLRAGVSSHVFLSLNAVSGPLHMVFSCSFSSKVALRKSSFYIPTENSKCEGKASHTLTLAARIVQSLDVKVHLLTYKRAIP